QAEDVPDDDRLLRDELEPAAIPDLVSVWGAAQYLAFYRRAPRGPPDAIAEPPAHVVARPPRRDEVGCCVGCPRHRRDPRAQAFDLEVAAGGGVDARTHR